MDAMSTTADSIRLKLNLKNLRRHDDTIHSIITSTSYVVIYELTNDAWTKTKIEGPMFLFKRSVEPFYGFFILNRQGLEYIQQDLTLDASIELMGDFIAFESSSDQRIHGIWCYEPEAREAMFDKMEQLRHHSVEAPNQPRQALPYNKSISIDLLFASPVVSSAILPNLIPKASTSKESPLHQRNDNTKPAGLQLLDSIFKSVEQIAPPPALSVIRKASTAAPRDGRSILAMIGHASTLPSPPLPPSTVSIESSSNQLALLLPPAVSRPAPMTNGSSSQSRPLNLEQQESPAPNSSKPVAKTLSVPTPTKSIPPPFFAPPMLSHDIFDSPVIRKAVAPVAVNGTPSSSKTVNGKVTAPNSSSKPVVVAERQEGSDSKSALTKPSPKIQSPPAPIAVALAPARTTPRATAIPVLSPRSKSKQLSSPATTTTPTDPRLSKDRVASLLNDAASRAKIGMEGSELDGEPLEKGEFVRRVLEKLYTPAFSTGLYADYLKRFSEEQE